MIITLHVTHVLSSCPLFLKPEISLTISTGEGEGGPDDTQMFLADPFRVSYPNFICVLFPQFLSNTANPPQVVIRMLVEKELGDAEQWLKGVRE